MKGGKVALQLPIAGRLPIDVRVAAAEFLRGKVNNFSSVVADAFGKERQ
jgi:hypothetical protein